jgi:short-subunit dehydrogenase involved in D-alanine esterification of teichoic acids
MYWQDGDCYNYFATALTDTVLITGSTDGIGVTTARNILSKQTVLIHGRDEDRIRTMHTIPSNETNYGGPYPN